MRINNVLHDMLCSLSGLYQDVLICFFLRYQIITAEFGHCICFKEKKPDGYGAAIGGNSNKQRSFLGVYCFGAV